MANENDIEDLNQPRKQLEPEDLEGVVGGSKVPIVWTHTGNGDEVDG